MTLRGVPLSTEHCIAVSPVWLRLIDTYTGQAPVGQVLVAVERREASHWVPVDVRYELKPTGDLAFANLGRVRRDEAGRPLAFRVTVTAERTISETTSGAPSALLNVITWYQDAPPAGPGVQVIRCYPAPDYRYGPGVPLLSGRVALANAGWVARARVRVTETALGKTLTEEVRTSDEGWFRLPLRWSSGSTQISADRSGASGSVTINVPNDLGSIVSVTIS